MEGFNNIIDAILEAEQDEPRKQGLSMLDTNGPVLDAD